MVASMSIGNTKLFKINITGKSVLVQFSISSPSHNTFMKDKSKFDTMSLTEL